MGYKDKLTKIVIENTKSVKEAPEVGKVYGPFDESEYGTKAVESYVVCEADNTNCVGYLQSNGKVIANSDSSYLFANFSNITNIDKLENLDTSNVIKMGGMFVNCSSLTLLDLSNFSTNNVTDVSSMFAGMNNLQELNLSNWKFNDNILVSFSSKTALYQCSALNNLILKNVDTSEVTNMNSMFVALSITSTKNLKSLDLSDFDTNNVTNFYQMFASSSSLQYIIFGPNFVYKSGAITSGMFDGCETSERPTDESWSGVVFDY